MSHWTTCVKRVALLYGVSLSSSTKTSSSSKSTCASFIKSALRKDKPVGSLNLALPIGSGQEEAWHWVTITKYYQGSDDNRWIAVSSMGERRGIDWDAYYANIDSSILDGGFIYFE